MTRVSTESILAVEFLVACVLLAIALTISILEERPQWLLAACVAVVAICGWAWCGCGGGSVVRSASGEMGGAAGSTTMGAGLGGAGGAANGDGSAPVTICAASPDCPNPTAPSSCMSAVCDPSQGHGYDDAGPLGCYLVSSQPGAPCTQPGGAEGVCTQTDAGADTVCCPFSGSCG